MSRAARFFLVAAVLLCIVAADQATKLLAQKSLADAPAASYLAGIARLELVHNRGAFLSFGENLSAGLRSLLFEVLVGIALAVTLLFTFRLGGAHPAQLAALALLTGGGLGNLIDRLAHDGEVIDFLSLGLGPLRTGIFNLADAAITTGALLLLLPWRPASPPPGPPAQAAPSTSTASITPE
jgi:signal peptidase II